MKLEMKSLRWGSSGREVMYVFAPENRRSLVSAEELQEQTITWICVSFSHPS
jgi:hypothetical protein